MRVGILGGYGNAGGSVARLLRRHSAHDLLLLGRDPAKLERAVADLRSLEGAGSVAGTSAGNGADPGADMLRDLDVLVVAAPITNDPARWAGAALDAGCDWFDLLVSTPAKWAALRALEPRAVAEGRALVTDGGVHPGLPGALVRLAAGRIPLRRARVALRFALPWDELEFSRATIVEFAEELGSFDPRVYVDGAWLRGWRLSRRFDFGPPVGPVSCAPMYLPELEECRVAIPDLEEIGMWVAGFGPLVDYVAMPLAAALQAVPGMRSAAGGLLGWGLRTFGSTTGTSIVLLEATGPEDTAFTLRLECDDAYVLTTAPVVAALLQWEACRRPGLTTQALMVSPEPFLADLERLGLHASTPCR